MNVVIFCLFIFHLTYFQFLFSPIIVDVYYEWLLKTKLISNPNELWIVNPQWIHN